MSDPNSDDDEVKRPYTGRSIALLGSSRLTKAVAQEETRPPLLKRTLKAAIIGHTGRGDYGHELDEIFSDREDLELVALADASETGRKKTENKLAPIRGYADFRQMLQQAKPDLVCIAPRHADQHKTMALACLEAGAHILLDKPFVRDPAEADEILKIAAAENLKVAVAHQMRVAPNVVHLRDVIRGGMIGRLLEIRAWGKQDHRAGGEDMMVLGVHQFDLMRMFAGDPLSCSARVLRDGREFNVDDARIPDENVGPVAGDEIVAHFTFAKGVEATWTSRRALREQVGNWAIEFQGSAGAARINCSIPPMTFVSRKTPWDTNGRLETWEPLINDPLRVERDTRYNFRTENARVVDDWINAIRTDGVPICSGANAAAAIEMVMAVYRAALAGQRVNLPLKNRMHPLPSR
ncbi:MAG: Gfo/Idh/MocA family protein [Limisphaerales bacterium]